MDQHSSLSRAARTSRLTLVTIALLMGCAHESAPAATTAPITEPEPESTAGESDTAAGNATPEPAATAVVETPPNPEPAEEPPPPVPVDMTPAAAPALCASLVNEPDGLQRSEFKRGGITLPGDARADVLECAYNDPTNGEVVAAYLIIRVTGDDFVTSEELGEAYEVPGNSVSYRLGRVERVGTGVRIRVTNTDTIYPNTGDPEASSRPEVDNSRREINCTRDAESGMFECARE